MNKRVKRLFEFDPPKDYKIFVIISFLILFGLGFLLGYIISEKHNFFSNKDCYEQFKEKKIPTYNGTIYGGYNCYERNDYLDMYFYPYENSNGRITDITIGKEMYLFRCYNEEDSCIVLENWFR